MSARDNLGEQFAHQTGHRPGGPGYGAPMHDVEEMYPDYHSMPHVYSSGSSPAHHPLGSPERAWARRSQRADAESHAAITSARGRPDADVTVYRAMPSNGQGINRGDWVTPSRTYAELHKESNGQPDWQIAQRTVKAKHLFSEGNSVAEWGWHPE